MTINIGVLGLGSVFTGPYRMRLQDLERRGLARVTTVFDPDPEKSAWASQTFDCRAATDASQVTSSEDVDAVIVLTSMREHSALAIEAMHQGKHVLVEKPMATSLEDAQRVMAVAAETGRVLVCAPHILLSPTFRQMHAKIADGEIGTPLLARARYGWSGPWWGAWFYRDGGGALFDLGVYNLTTLCGFMGPVKRVTAFAGTAIPQRTLDDGSVVDVEVEDNAHVLLDFGESRFASIMTGFTIQKYRSPAVEIYGSQGVLQMLGDDWAPEGFEQWRTDAGVWEVVPEIQPGWPWTEGVAHLVDCVSAGTTPVTKPEHAYHALDVMLAAQRSARSGQVVEITSTFPPLDYSSLPPVVTDKRALHDRRSTS
jgi:predicted dehydrogenase